MGLVYQGKHRDIDKPVAIKVLRDDLSRRPEVVARFRQEARSASRIGHENIVDVSDFGETRFGSSYFVMEFLEGEDLANVLGREVTLEPERACRIVLQCCRALSAAHDKQIVHRDIKPENIFLTRRDGVDEFVKLVDFGIAKMGDIETEGSPGRKLTKTGMIFGTPEYMSPEQAAGKELDHRVDVYALGIILYECLAGTVPFVGDTFMGILTQHLFSEAPALREQPHAAEVSPELELVIAKALAKDPDHRYQSAAELAEAVECALEGKISTATVVTPPPALLDTDPAPPQRRVRWVWGAAATAAIVLLGAWIGSTGEPGVEASDARAEPRSSPSQASLVERSSPPEPPASPTEGKEAPASVPEVTELHIATSPMGARVTHADGSEACSETPCTIEVARGTSLVLRAKLGRRTGRTKVMPTREETVLIELEAPKRSATKTRKSARAKPRSEPAHRASDLKVPEWAR